MAGNISSPTFDDIIIEIPSDNNNPFESAVNCQIDAFDPLLPSPRLVGVDIEFKVKTSCDTGA